MKTAAPERSSDVVAEVRSAIRRDDLRAAGALARRYRVRHGVTSEALEALSWVARGLLNKSRFTDAAERAKQVHRLAVERIEGADPHLMAALGASIEVIAQAIARRGRRAEAVRFLKRELDRAGTSPIHTRIRKNLNLLTMSGLPAPELEISEWIGRRPPSLAELRDQPVLLFFWAHYCPDSRTQGRVLARIRDQFGPRGLALTGPTRPYGYFDEERTEPANPREELRHIKRVLEQNYPHLSGMPVPVSEHNFVVYGVSTTPTLALIDRGGSVSLYHPGKLPYTVLSARVRELFRAAE